MRHVLLRLLLTLSCATVVVACGDSSDRAANGKPGEAAAVRKMEGQLDLLLPANFWSETQGVFDKAWLLGFEKASSCQVRVQRATSPEQMLVLAERGDIDLIVATGEIAGSLVQSGRVQALDTEQLPALTSVVRRLAQGPWTAMDGVSYGVPLQWDTMRLQYDSRAIGANTTVELADLFQERALGDGKSNAGRVRAFDRPIELADAALYLREARPDLGITDPYALDEKQYAAVLEALRQQRRLAAVNDAAAVIAGNWGGAAPLSIVQPPLSALEHRPTHGSSGWVAVSMLRTGAAHPNCAMAWMQWSLQPEVQAQIAGEFRTMPVIESACAAREDLGPSWCEGNQFGQIDQVYFWRTPTVRCGTKLCVPYSRWVADFAEIAATPLDQGQVTEARSLPAK